MESKLERVILNLDSPKGEEEAELMAKSLQGILRNMKREGTIDDKTEILLNFSKDEG